MAKHTRTQTDGITTTTTTTVDARSPTSRADRAAFRAALAQTRINASFELKMQEIEAELRALCAGAVDAPQYGSQAYYATEILDTLARLRRLRETRTPKGADAALAAAMTVGYLAAEMDAKGWPLLAMGLQAHAEKQRGGHTRGQQIARAARRKNDEIARHYKRWFMSDELQDDYRSPAAYIATKVQGVTKRTINNHIAEIRQTGK